MTPLQDILVAFELHSADRIMEGFKKGVDPNGTSNGQPLFYELVNMYTRGPGFKECVRVFVDHGLRFQDKALLAVLLDDAALLLPELQKDGSVVDKKYSLNCTFTPLLEASLLHICAEYNHLRCAKVLVEHSADVNLKAGLNNHGFGGHTPVFHTVNQDANQSMDMLKFLLSQNADLGITVKGLIWGQGYEWETFIPSVNPISYAMMGLLRQFQRTEQQIYEVVSLLMKAKYGIEYLPENIPNKYLKS